jgi:hypothetical protein
MTVHGAWVSKTRGLRIADSTIIYRVKVALHATPTLRDVWPGGLCSSAEVCYPSMSVSVQVHFGTSDAAFR